MPLLQQLASVHLCSFRGLSSNVKSSRLGVATRSDHVPAGQLDHQAITVQRQPSNYQPTIWDYDYIQSIKSHYIEESHEKRADKLKGEVMVMLEYGVVDPLCQLELIDVLERLGISYHFDKDINKILMNIYNINGDFDSSSRDKDLHEAALRFRLLRKHGFNVPQGVFSRFMEESSGNFKACLCEDIKGILSLYEASYLLVQGESILEKARDFTTQLLEHYVNNYYKDDGEGQELSLSDIRHALEFPQHWRPPRVESRWFIDAYDKNHVLLELAILDFNIVQAIHQEDLKHMSRWWNNIGLAQKYHDFSRDRVMECFLWGSVFLYEPRFQHFRKITTQIYALISTVDDVYDNYATFEEQKLFTAVIERWDVSAMEQLPDYLKQCYMAIFNSTNNFAYQVLKTHGIDVSYYLKKTWVDMCKSYIVEAEWNYSGNTPSLDEYIENSWVSVGIPTVLVHNYFTVANPITDEALKALENYHDLIRYAALILRLADDIDDDYPSNGDFPKAVQCHMHETGASLEDAREHVKDVISATWTKLNKAAAGCPFPTEYVRAALNIARMGQQMYHDGDGHASQNQASKNRILSLLVHPIAEPF